MKKLLMNKKGIATEYLPWIIIAVGVLALIMISIFFLKDKSLSLFDQLKNLLGGG